MMDRSPTDQDVVCPQGDGTLSTASTIVQIKWRPMSGHDLDAVIAVAAAVHINHPERPEVLAERLGLFPAGAWIAVAGTVAVGYALIHPGLIGRPPALDTLLGSLPVRPDCLYLHDVALLPRARGQGLAARLLADVKVLGAAKGLNRLALVAVNGSAPVWRRFGFMPWPGDAFLQEKLAGYGDDAMYMTCSADA